VCPLGEGGIEQCGDFVDKGVNIQQFYVDIFYGQEILNEKIFKFFNFC